MKISRKELVTFAESITSALEEIATKIGAVEDIISGDKEVEDDEVEIDEDGDEDIEVDVDEDVEDADEEEADEEVAVEDEEAPTENFSERLDKIKNFLNM